LIQVTYLASTVCFLTNLTKVLSTLPEKPQENSNSPVPFFHVLERLKTTKREGWRRFNVTQGESISDHMYRMAIISMCAPASLKSKINLDRCVRLALVHDMAELIVGDITPVDGVTKPEKNRREALTMEYLSKGLLGSVDGGAAGEDIRAAWQEYEDSKTPEAIFVHDVDKLELLLQMFEYERTAQGKTDLSEFAYVAKKIETDEVRQWADEIMAKREDYWKSIGKPLLNKTQTVKHKAEQDEYYAK
jgi:putative hydrolase of HD superfamily